MISRASRPERIAGLISSSVEDATRPFLLGPDKHAYAPADLEGAVVYGRVGSALVCIGDPIGPDGWTAFDRLADVARRRRLTLGVYQATAAAAACFEARGWQTVPVGLEAVLGLATFSLEGARRANLRHTITRAQRGGVSVTWHLHGLTGAGQDTHRALADVDRDWAIHAGPAMGFTITRFGPKALADTPVAVAWADSLPIAFVTFRACGPRMYVLDVMRRRDGGIPGALESCVARGATELAASADRLSLGLTALAGLDPYAESRTERWLAHGAEAVAGLYDVAGLAFFKGKFDPTWQPRFLALRAESLPLIAGALLWLHLVDETQPASAVAAAVARSVLNLGRAQLRSSGRRGGSTLKGRQNAEDGQQREPPPPLTAATPNVTSNRAHASRVSARQRMALVIVSAAAVKVGFAFGRRMHVRQLGALAVADALFVAAVGIGSRRSRDHFAAMPRSDADDQPRDHLVLTVLVAARNEENVLPDLIRDLAAQDLRRADGSPAFDVIVVDDRSTDQTLHRTLASARRHGIEANVSVRPRRGRQLPDGKGAALRHVPLDDCAELVLVLDADARLGRTVLREVANLADGGLDAMTLRRRSVVPDGSWLGACQADELVVDAAIEEARWAFGGSSEFRGNGMVVRRNVLVRAGGWRDALTEDIDLTARMAITSGARGVAWPPRPVIDEEAVLRPGDLWQQRVRWAEGTIRAWLEWTPRLVWRHRRSPLVVVELMAYASQLLVPLVSAGAVGGALRRRRMGGALAIPAAYFAAVAAIGFDGLRREPPGGPATLAQRIGRSLRVASFMSLWFVATPVAIGRVLLQRGPIRYHATAHARRASP